VGVLVIGESVKDTLTPAPDGVIVDFQTLLDYKPGTVSVWLNGIKLIDIWDDGFEELGGKTIRMKDAPWVGDSLQAEYEPA